MTSSLGTRSHRAGSGPAVLVGIPAHNEQANIATAVGAVLAAARHAFDAGVISCLDLVVVAHKCTDDTAITTRSTAEINTNPRVRVSVLEDEHSVSVGGARALAASAALGSDRYGWVCATDADSVVPTTWMTELLTVAARSGADVVLPLVELDSWTSSKTAHAAYQELVAEGVGDHGHEHVYGANFMMRGSLYRHVGGFRPVAVAEDHDLVARARLAGAVIASPVEPIVATSARFPGRAAGGLGSLLARLDAANPEPCEPGIGRLSHLGVGPV